MLGLTKRTIINKRHTILTTLYKSLVRPHLEYSTAAWSPHYVKDREMLERVQRIDLREWSRGWEIWSMGRNWGFWD